MRSHLHRLREHLEPLGVAPAEALALLILLAGAASLTALVWWNSRPAPDPLPVPQQASDLPDVTSATIPDGPPVDGVAAVSDTVVVHVAGHVAHPGVVTLPAGARVSEAIDAAGGATDEGVLDDLNLARTLTDGEQVRVPGPDDPPGAVPTAAGGVAADPDAPLDLNAATVEQLETLPGIGPVMAHRIIEHRAAIGGFAAVTQLLEVPGIGPARFAELQPRVAV